jgi:hypothetical protein
VAVHQGSVGVIEFKVPHVIEGVVSSGVDLASSKVVQSELGLDQSLELGLRVGKEEGTDG